mgnify:CR=1 FL=1
MNLINSSKLSDFDKLVNNKKFKKIFIITGENSFYKSKANLLIKFSKIKTLKFFFKKSKFPELSELYLILKEVFAWLLDVIFDGYSGTQLTDRATSTLCWVNQVAANALYLL